jgi:tetratricopeptide (TPR) repeat protein
MVVSPKIEATISQEPSKRGRKTVLSSTPKNPRVLLEFLRALGGLFVAVIISLAVFGQATLHDAREWYLGTETICRECQDAKSGQDRAQPIGNGSTRVPQKQISLETPKSYSGQNHRDFVASEERPSTATGEAISATVGDAMALVSSGHPLEAKNSLLNILKKNLQNEEALVGLGVIAKQSFGELQEARTHFEKALHLNPENQFALNELVSLYTEQNNTAEGIKFLEDLSGQYPDAPGVLLSRARLLEQTGRETEALPLLESLAIRQNGSVEILHELAHAHLRAGNTERSLAILDDIMIREANFSRSPEAGGDREQRLNIIKLNKVDILVTRNDRLHGDLEQAQRILDEVTSLSGDDAQIANLKRRIAEAI